MELLVQRRVGDQRISGVVVDDRVQLHRGRAQLRELVSRRPPLRGEPRGGALEDATQLDRVGDVVPCEPAYREATAGKRLEQPLVLEGHQCELERRP